MNRTPSPRAIKRDKRYDEELQKLSQQSIPPQLLEAAKALQAKLDERSRKLDED